MGMFDYENGFDATISPWERASATAEQSRQGLMRENVDPLIEETTGYVSPQVQMKRMVAATDLSNLDSVQNTFNTLMKRSPPSAAKWLKSVEPLLKEHQSASKGDVATTRMKDIRDIASNKYGCDINDQTKSINGMSCYDAASKEWLINKRGGAEAAGAKVLSEEEAKSWIKLKDTSRNLAQASNKRLATINQSLSILDTNTVYSGPGGSLVNIANNIGGMFGIDSAELSAANAKQFLSNSMTTVMEWVSQTKGAISDKEMTAFTKAAEGLSTTKLGNRLLLTTLKKVAEYNQRHNVEMARWLEEQKRIHRERFPSVPFTVNPNAWDIHESEWKKEVNPNTNEVNGIVFPTAQELSRALGKSSEGADSVGADLNGGKIVSIRKQ